MTVGALIRASGLPSLEAEVLAAAAVERNRAWIIAHSDEKLTREQCVLISDFFDRRCAGEPVAYITGMREFFGRNFKVTPAVLIPRPATEELVQVALSFLKSPQAERSEADSGIVIVSHVLRPEWNPHIVVDIGTGSGCIAITLALERPDIQVIATDVSAEALNVARENAALHHVADRVSFVEGKGLDPVQDLHEPFLLVSNPPYIPEGRTLQREVVEFEPPQALFAGKDGMVVLRRILTQAQAHPCCTGVIVECQTDQAHIVPRPGHADRRRRDTSSSV